MLAQLLRRDFMLKSMEKLSGGLREQADKHDQGDPDVSNLMDHAGVVVDELRIAGNELEAAIKREATDEKNGAAESAFFARDAIVSLAQSALQEFCEEKKAHRIMQTARGAGGLKQIPVTDMEMDASLASFLSSDPPQRGLWGKYELLDIGWANCLTAIGVRKWRKRHPFNDKPSKPFIINNRARVVLVSDWASGLPRAKKVSQVIREMLDEAVAANRETHVIHLGDVYYSGLAREYESNFLADWPVKKTEADLISSWALNANHDMYSGGWGYFEYLLRDDPRFKRQQDLDGNPSSFFSLENDHWLMLGLDTGYHDNLIFDAHDLYGSQSHWVTERLTGAPNKSGIVLTHHQPFSSFEKGAEMLLRKLETPLKAGAVQAWFWGHEHRCALYEPRENIEYPRCIGHGGVPFYVSNAKPAPFVTYEYRQGFSDYLESWNYFGFVVMDFEEQNIKVRYINERGVKHHEEVITRK